jgi:peptide/nickel transport system substrate-binding protein
MRSITINSLKLASVLILISLLLTACQSAVVATDLPATVPAATPTPTTPPQRTLTVCLGSEPSSLYLYNGLSQAAWSILEAVYDGPVDLVSGVYQPVILTSIPSLAAGDAVISPVDVKAGDEVINTAGDLVTLSTGVEVFPTGCNAASCAVKYDGSSPLQMDQLTVTFHLKDGITWSDGTPLTADDSVYSYQLAQDSSNTTSRSTLDRTFSYVAKDTLTTVWTGKPGTLDANYPANFWLPLPKHAWESIASADLLTAEESTRQPLGWGPYIIQEWTSGDHITLKKNPKYWRAAEGLPVFDTLVYRFVGDDMTQNLAALQSGECDILDPSTHLEEQVSALDEFNQTGKGKVLYGETTVWEALTFGIQPASYDDVYNAAQDRPDLFGDVRTRQAFAYCMDRQGVVDDLLGGKSTVWNTFLSPSNPFTSADVKTYPFDPQQGSKLLDEAGWQDSDNDPTTPRVAVNVRNVPPGTLLQVTYRTTQAELRQKVSQRLAESMVQCGIGVTVETSTPDELFAEGPTGVIFGRNFDLAEFNWSASLQPQCFLYQSQRIPKAANNWLGVNVGGFTNAEYDAACQSVLSSLPEQPVYAENLKTAQNLFAENLPAVPLYATLKTAVTRTDFCGLKLDPTVRSDLWNLESLDYGESCQP